MTATTTSQGVHEGQWYRRNWRREGCTPAPERHNTTGSQSLSRVEPKFGTDVTTNHPGVRAFQFQTLVASFYEWLRTSSSSANNDERERHEEHGENARNDKGRIGGRRRDNRRRQFDGAGLRRIGDD